MSSQATSSVKKFSTAPVDARSSSYQAPKAPSDGSTMKEGSQSTTKPNAWSKPLQGAPNKPKNSNSGNGSNKGPRSAPPPPGYASKPSASSVAIEKTLPALRERFLHLLLTLTGQKVTVSLTSGVSYTGILHTATPFSHLASEQRNKYVLRAVTVSGANGESVQPGSTVLLDMDQIVQLHCKACRLDALVTNSVKAGDSFTDTEISRAANAHAARKDFVAVDATWTSAGEASTLPPLPINSKAAKLAGLTSVPTNGALKGNIEGWDQFKANEELFNVVGSFDETVYTTVLDHSQISAQERHRAEKLAREIESATTTNIHMAEERGQVAAADLADYDEEDRYSGVLKSVAKPKLNYAQAVASATTTTAIDEAILSDDKVDAEEPSGVVENDEIIANDDTPGVLGNLMSEKVKVPSLESVHLGEKESEAAAAAAAAADSSESKAPEVKSKLNASAKEFSFNVNAKSFQPTPPPPPPPLPPPQFVYDPATGMSVMLQPHMIPGGMMPPMMNPGQYPGMRYAGQYPGMEFPQPSMPHMHPMHPQQRPTNAVTPSTSTATAQAPEDAPTPVSEEESVAQSEQNQPADGTDANHVADPQQPQSTGQLPQRSLQPPPPPAGHSMPHAMPMQPHLYYPGGYYNPAMGMFPPGGAPQYVAPHMAVHMPRQMYNTPGMPAGSIPPNMMRGPPTYYPGPNGPVPYPQYGAGGGAYGGADEETMNYGGRGRGGRGSGRGGRNSGRGQGRGLGGGRSGGRGRYNHQYSGGSSSLGDSGRETPQESVSSQIPVQTSVPLEQEATTASAATDATKSNPPLPSNIVSETAPVVDNSVETYKDSNGDENGKNDIK